MYVSSSHIAEYGSAGYGCQSCSWSAGQGNIFCRCLRSRLRIWSRETGSAVPSSVRLAQFPTLRLNLVLTHGTQACKKHTICTEWLLASVAWMVFSYDISANRPLFSGTDTVQQRKSIINSSKEKVHLSKKKVHDSKKENLSV